MLLNYLLDERTKTESYAVTNKKTAAKMPFLVDGFGKFDVHSSYFTEREGMASFLFLYTEAGEGLLEYQGKRLIIPENCGAVIDCRRYQLYRSASTERWKFYWIHFNGKCACDFENMINEAEPAVIDFSGRLHIEGYYQELIRLITASDTNVELRFSNQLNDLLSQMLILRHAQQLHHKHRAHQSDIERSIAYIRAHYAEPLTVEALAKISRISKYYYIRLFRELIGDTPYNFLTLYRLNESKKLLTDTDYSIGQIASAIGFSSAKNYIDAFKKATGITPLKYRQTNLM